MVGIVENRVCAVHSPILQGGHGAARRRQRHTTNWRPHPLQDLYQFGPGVLLITPCMREHQALSLLRGTRPGSIFWQRKSQSIDVCLCPKNTCVRKRPTAHLLGDLRARRQPHFYQLGIMRVNVLDQLKLGLRRSNDQ